MRKSLIMLAVLAIAVPAMATPFGAGYRETWNVYAVGGGAAGDADPLYQSVWKPYVVTTGTVGDATYAPGTVTAYPTIASANSISSPNSIKYEQKNRALVNKLNDGITNGTLDGTELPLGAVLKPDPSVALDDTRSATNYTNLQLRNYIGFTAGAARAHTAQYVELSYGEIHAPTLTGGLTPLTEAIPVIALGKFHTQTVDGVPVFTGTGGPSLNGSAVYLFNGKQWINTGLATVAGTQGLVAKIFYDSDLAKWRVKTDWIFSTTPGSMGSSNTFDLAFDPTVLGFDTVSWNMLNASPSNNAGSYYDDVWVAGGLVVPEPATMALLGMGFLAIRRRR